MTGRTSDTPGGAPRPDDPRASADPGLRQGPAPAIGAPLAGGNRVPFTSQLRSRPGEGATFTVVIPVDQPRPEDVRIGT